MHIIFRVKFSERNLQRNPSIVKNPKETFKFYITFMQHRWTHYENGMKLKQLCLWRGGKNIKEKHQRLGRRSWCDMMVKGLKNQIGKYVAEQQCFVASISTSIKFKSKNEGRGKKQTHTAVPSSSESWMDLFSSSTASLLSSTEESDRSPGKWKEKVELWGYFHSRQN